MGLTIHVNVAGWPDAPEALLRRAVSMVFEAEAIEDAELSVTLQSDADIAGLNTEYLSREGPTDVIAFALHEGGEPVLGDVYVGYGRAVAQAEERGIPLREELARLTIHGVPRGAPCTRARPRRWSRPRAERDVQDARGSPRDATRRHVVKIPDSVL